MSRNKEFVKELNDLLVKYNASITVEEKDVRPYLGGTWYMEVTFHDYDENETNLVDLGGYLDGQIID